MAITVDYTVTPHLITVPQSDLTLESGSKYFISVDTFWELLRDYADSEESMPFSTIYSRTAATASTPSITEVTDDYEIQFEDGLYSVDIRDGNTNVREKEVKNQVSVNTNNTTGFINPTFLESGLFDGGVAIDTVNGVALTSTGKTAAGNIIGTRDTPVNNLADALTIASDRGFFKLFALSDITLDAGDLTGFTIVGVSEKVTAVTFEVGATTTNMTIKRAEVSGNIAGVAEFINCIIKTLSSVSGLFRSCGMDGTITLSGGGQTEFIDCFDLTAGLAITIIDMGGSGQSLVVRNYNGGLQINNKTGTEEVSIDMDPGRVVLDSTVTNGNILVRGIGTLTDNSDGATVNNQVVNLPEIANAVWTEVIDGTFTAEEITRLIASASAAKLSGAETTTIVIRDLSDTKDRITATVDADGNRTSVTVDAS